MAQTLLLADDSVTIQRVVALTFADEDIHVVAVGDGDTAIARIESEPPDIVLADIGMPGLTGYDVARYIKQSSRLAHIPVVLLVGAFEPVDDAQAAEVGCNAVLAKPFEPQAVIATVKELLLDATRLAAEQGPAIPPQDAVRPTEAGSPPPLDAPAGDAPPSEALIDAVVRRVLDRLTEAVTRDQVAGIVSTVAERLVREEIERIKSSIT
jgi:CheY-like chemotaxis protein